MNTKLLRASLLVVSLLTVLQGQSTDPPDNVSSVPKQTFKEAEKEVTDFINEQLRAILPKVVGGAGTTTLSQKCQAGMMKIFGSIRRLKGWTLKILDSMGKPAAGVLKGNSYSLGHYDQCVDLLVHSKGYETHNISEAMFQGMYCKIRIQFKDPIVETARNYYRGEKNVTMLGKLKEIILETPYVPVTSEFMSHYLGVCVPSSCTLEDVNEIVQLIPVPASVTVEGCEIKSETEINTTQFTVIILFLILFGLICLSSFIHWLCHNSTKDKTSTHRDCRCVSVTVAFSFCNNTKQLLKNVEDDTNHTLGDQCVRGIVAASVAWIILGHTYLLPYDAFYMQSSSLENLQNYLAEGYFALVVNYPLAIDALFVCYGFIMTYSLWYAAYESQDVKVNIISLIIQNYFRIFIPVIIFLGVVVLLPLIGSGPFWNDFMSEAVSKCSKNPWPYIGMYSNFLEEDEQCFPHLWFASCLAQLTLVSIILSWILSRNMKFGVSVIVLLTIAGNAVVGIYTYNNGFPPSYVAYFMDDHFGPYALGMLAGILVTRKSTHPFRPFLATLGWIICLCLIVSLLLFIYKHHLEPMNAICSAVYAGCHRTVFAVCVTWIIVSCSIGNGGFVNTIFSWKVFDPIFRLSYYCYIFHFLVIAFTVGVSREHFSYSHIDLIMKAVSYIVVSYFLSYIAYMILEMPLKSLCSVHRKKSSQINVTPLNNFDMDKTDNLMPNSLIAGSCKLWSVSNNKVIY